MIITPAVLWSLAIICFVSLLFAFSLYLFVARPKKAPDILECFLISLFIVVLAFAISIVAISLR